MNSDEKTITGAQCRAARALLDWSREDLAAASKVSRAAIADFEQAKRQVRERTVDDLQAALESAGIAFIPGGAEGAGVRLKDPQA